ncbi:copper chaperone PCu(A)C [Alphaproteobacteria bacterium HT1-32]|nr:copper chaperone PCu(A)C [Alphaproteobacteria bacterium HT1-32]|tara:strand:+ start:6299 stop:6778 length:480 start_codon:yes stop_codon:yes gene_type:complete
MSVLKNTSIVGAFCLLLIVMMTAQARADNVRKGGILIEAPWARASIGMSRPAAAYLSIRNAGDEPVILIKVSTPVSEMAEIHESTMSDGTARMGPAGDLVIPAGSEVVLMPGGLHIMMMKLKQPLIKGDKFNMTLIFKEIGTVDVQLPVLGVGASGPTN